MTNALKYAQLVAIAGTTQQDYGPEQTDALKQMGYELVQPVWGMALSEKATFGYVAHNEQETAVAFRGTAPEKLMEWLEDGNCEQVPLSNKYKVHQGFKAVYESLSWHGQVEGRLTICGHSLGASLATLWAMDYFHEGDRVITFGGPRVGNDEFVKAYNTFIPTERYTNFLDPIPDLPPEELGYRHVGQKIRLPLKLAEIEKPGEGHFLETYIKLLQNGE